MTSGVYRDVSIQDKYTQHERLALIQMMDASPFRESSCYHGKLIAPMVYEETMTNDFFEAWFQKFLLSILNTPSVIIMDDARFYIMGKLELLCEEFGHKFLPLPPYSPEYNPIEKTWANIKKVLPSCNTLRAPSHS